MTIPIKKISLSFLLAPALGGVIGIFYSVLDEENVKQLFGLSTPPVVVFTHNILDWFLPVILGILIGIGIKVLRKQARLNKALSLQNIQYQRDLLVTTLISQFLHEIRNPVHNLTAVFEDGGNELGDERRQVIQRNLECFEEIFDRYKGLGSIFNSIDPAEPLVLQPWIEAFIADKIQGRLREIGVHYEQKIEPVQLKMHPILLEQCLLTLFSNALDELSKIHLPRQLNFFVRCMPESRKIELKMTNTSNGFPKEVLQAQGRRFVASARGTGVGLLLLRKMLERVDGELSLANSEGMVEARLWIPGEKL